MRGTFGSSLVSGCRRRRVGGRERRVSKTTGEICIRNPAHGQFNAYIMPGAQNPGTTPSFPLTQYTAYQTTVVTTTRHTVSTNITCAAPSSLRRHRRRRRSAQRKYIQFYTRAH